MSKGIELKKIGLLLISFLILMVIASPISADEIDDSPNLDIPSNDNIDLTQDIDINADNQINENENENPINSNPSSDNTEDNTLTQGESTNTQNSQYTLSDETYLTYFDTLGNIRTDTLKSGDTLIIKNLTNKKLIITLPLNLVGDENNQITETSMTIEKRGSNTNITGLNIINNQAFAIYLKNTTGVTVQNLYICADDWAIALANSNHNNILNNTLITYGDFSAVILGNSSYNNISYNTIDSGTDGIYLSLLYFLDYKTGTNHDNLITYNNISTSNTHTGINVYGDNNTIKYNNVRNSNVGIYTNGRENKIYYNNLTNNNEALSPCEEDYTLNNTIDGDLVFGNQYDGTPNLNRKGTVYVDGKNGNDNNQGTNDSPFKTIKAAVEYVNSKAEGLYTIIVREGTYKENNIQVKNNIELIGNGKVTINGDNKDNILYQKRSTYLKIKSISFINGRTKTNSDGGAIYSLGDLEIENCSFKNNKATKGCGAAIYLTTATIKDCSFSNNNALGQVGDDSLGSGVIFIKESLNLEGCNFTNNKGNGIITPYTKSIGNWDGYSAEIAKINVNNCIFDRNTGYYSDKNAGYIVGGDGNITNSSFTNNNGSGVWGLKLNIDRCYFANNLINNTYQDIGGAICIYGNGTIKNSEFINNTAANPGGAIFAIAAKVQNCTFIHNHAKNGGAIYGEDLNVRNCTFINNSAKNYGGAIYTQKLIAKNSSFINNSARVGGAIAMSEGEVSQSTFEGNRANEGMDIFIMNYYTYTYRPTGRIDGLGRAEYEPVPHHQNAKITLGDDIYWGDIDSKDKFYSERRIVNGDPTVDLYDDAPGGINRLIYLAPNNWIHPDGSGAGNGEGSSIGDGSGTGTGTGDGNGNGDGYGSGNGNGDGYGSGNGNGDGTGTGNGDGNGNGTSHINGNGTGENNINSNITGNTTNNNANNENISGDITDKSSNEETEIDTDVGTYSTDPSKSEEPSQESSSSSSSSPGESGGQMKAYELEKQIKKIDLMHDTWQKLLLALLFLSLIIIGYYKEKRDDEKENK